MLEVTLDEAKEKLGELFEAAAQGEEVFIGSNGTQVQLVVRAAEDAQSNGEPKKARRAGSMKGMIHVPPDFNEPLEDFKEYME